MITLGPIRQCVIIRELITISEIVHKEDVGFDVWWSRSVSICRLRLLVRPSGEW